MFRQSLENLLKKLVGAQLIMCNFLMKNKNILVFFYASLKYNWEHQLAARLESSLKLKRKRDERDLQ